MKQSAAAVLVAAIVTILAAACEDDPPQTQMYTLNVSVDPLESGGRVSQQPEPDAQGQYARGTVVQLTASSIGDKDGGFQGWSGDAQGSNPMAEITMDSDKSVTARFCGDGIVCVTLDDPGGGGTYAFDPSDFVFRVGDTVTFDLSAETDFHTFTIDDLGIDVEVDGGTTQTLTFTFDKTGTFDLICIPHQALMVGTITVQ